jgi:hypothetical protein
MQKDEGGLLKTQWTNTIMQTFSTDFGEVIRSYKDKALSANFVRGIAFQLIFSLGVARDAFGFFHNDLLSLSSSLRALQVLPGSPKRKTNWCYRLREGEDTGSFPVEAPRDPCDLSDPEPATPVVPAKFSTWCMPLNDVDGLQLKLYNFGVSVLKDTQLEWWQTGFTFQNVGFHDDMIDAAIIVCDFMGSKTLLLLEEAATSFCDKAKEGYFYQNPLEALFHPYFMPLFVQVSLIFLFSLPISPSSPHIIRQNK